MTRYVVLGNNIMTALFDSRYVMRELYYPLSTDNHLHAGRIGLWVDNRFSWIHDLDLKIWYDSDSLSSRVSAALGDVKIQVRDAIDLAYEILAREVQISTGGKEARIFFAWDFHIHEDEVGDTALYDPSTGSIIHYKRDRWFLFSCDIPFFQYATGYKETAGYQGTWKDCEDGVLSNNPIAQGAVDSAVSLRVTGDTKFYCWLVCGGDYRSVNDKHSYVQKRSAYTIIDRTEKYWKAWLSKARDYDEATRRSLLILAAHWQSNGAIPASLDTDIMKFNKDTYNYVWHRDAAFASIALSLIGYQDHSRMFFTFSRPLLYNGYLFQKYTVDGHWGSTWHPWIKGTIPFQEDETALMLYAMWVHFQKFLDVDFFKGFYRPWIKTAADFLASYRDKETGLPLPSYDLWEERLGTHFFTAATVYAGLVAAARFAAFFGEKDVEERYRAAAEEIKKGMDLFYVGGHFARSITSITTDRNLDKTIDASTVLGCMFVYDPKDTRVVSNREAVERALKVNGGIARYENDLYLREGEKPNPWFITTLWVSQQYIAEGNIEKAMEYLGWVTSRSLPTGVIPEQISPKGHYPSVAPLAWSHAELIRTAYFLKNGFSNFI